MRFQKHDEKYLKERDRIEKESQQMADEAVADAQNCLNSEIFHKYKESYKKLQEITLKELELIDQTEKDPASYGFRVKDIVSRLRVIGLLLEAVEKGAGK